VISGARRLNATTSIAILSIHTCTFVSLSVRQSGESHTGFRPVPQPVTLNVSERRKIMAITGFKVI